MIDAPEPVPDRSAMALIRFFSRHFLKSHTDRDADLEHWWQMPEDLTRRSSPWCQIGVDLIAEAPFSEWHERVAKHRVKTYDGLRATAVRGTLVLVVAVLLVPVNPPWWIWVMLLPAVAQTILEIYLYPYVLEGTPEPAWGFTTAMRDVAREHFSTKTLNFTGGIGAAACPLLVLAVCLAPQGGDYAWAKIGALAAAILYLNSGLASVFLDPPIYTESSVMPPAMHGVRPYAPFISLAVVSLMVAVGFAEERWAPELIPIAFMCPALALLMGSRIRDHDRTVAACAHVARDAVLDGRTALGRIVHDDLNPAKAAAESVSGVPGVPYEDVVDLRALAAYLKHFNTRIGLHASQRMHLDYLVDKLVSPYGISPRQRTVDIAWDEDKIRHEDHQIAIRMVTALVHNLAQALALEDNDDVPRNFAVTGYTTGDGRQLRFHLAVRDHLPLVNADRWCEPGGSLTSLRDWLRTDFNGDLIQQELGDGSKQIVASWDDQSPAEEPDDPIRHGE